MGKRILYLLEAILLRLRKIIVHAVAVVKCVVDSRGSDGTKINVRTNFTSFMHQLGPRS